MLCPSQDEKICGFVSRGARTIQAYEFFKEGEFFLSGDRTFQERAETRNDVADKLSKLMERWEQRIGPANRRFGERFLAGEIHILLVFRVIELVKYGSSALSEIPPTIESTPQAE